MNAERRATIRKAWELIDQGRAMLEECRDDEAAYRDAMPESLQSSERYANAERAVDAMDTLIAEIEAFDVDEVTA